MKRITFLLFMLVAVTAFAQKPEKPNTNKALKSFKEGKLDEAKAMIDLCATSEKTMNNGDTWYYRGLIYAALDSTHNEAYKSLAQEPLKTAMESFKKADELSKGGKEYSITGPDGILPITKPQQVETLATDYLNKGLKLLQDDENYEGALPLLNKSVYIFENGLKKYANDSLAYYLVGLANYYAEHYDDAITTLTKFIQMSGPSTDSRVKNSYLFLYNIYTGQKEDKAKALEVIREAKKKFPDNLDFNKLEIGLLIDLNKVDEAKGSLERAVKEEPNNETYHFFLGYVNSQLGDLEAARASFNNALRIKPDYFDAQYYLANTYLVEVDKTSKEINNLGISKEDAKKKQLLVQKRVKEAETALPYIEKAEKMKMPKETEVELYTKLSLLYYYVADDKNAERVQKKLKALGVD